MNNMKRIGTITYEFSEEEYRRMKKAVDDIVYYFNNASYKEDAEEGARILEEMFEEDE
jgi:hypothetical protein